MLTLPRLFQSWAGSLIYYSDMNNYRKVVETASLDNLCTYFILPFCLVDKLRFGGKTNFLESYLSADGKYIYVEVIEEFFVEDNLPNHDLIKEANRTFLRFKIPSEWNSDVKLFMEGKYSKLSEKAKRRIREGSTLEYRNYRGTVPFTDFRLMAIENSATIRAMWEEIIFDEVDIARKYEIGEELLSSPTERSFISFPLRP